MLLGEDQTKQKTLMRGVLVLLPAALFTKCVGLFYKLPLIRIVGVEGMAYFLAAYHLYSLLFMLTVTGVPSALSLMIARALAAGRRRAVRRIFAVCLGVLLLLGLLGSALLLFFAPALAARLAMREASAAILAIAPALCISAPLGAAKGYFQGHHQMGATALSEVLESAGKLAFGLALALRAKRLGLPTPAVAAYAVLGITLGMALAALVLCVWLLLSLAADRREGGGEPPKLRAVLCELGHVAIPITVSACVMGLSSLLDTALIPTRLQAAGASAATARMLYSSYGNLAVPLFSLVPSLLTPVALALTPLVGAAASQGDREGVLNTLRAATRLVLLVAVPASLGLAVFSTPLLTLLYGGQESAVAIAAPLLCVLALCVVPSCLMTLTGTVLQAIGHTVVPVVATGAGVAAKLLVAYLLLVRPEVGILAAPISTLCCTVLVLLIERVALSRALGAGTLPVSALLRPLLAALPGIALGSGIYFGLLPRVGASAWLTLLSVFCCVPPLLLLALPSGAVEHADLLALPGGERICTLLQACKLLK